MTLALEILSAAREAVAEVQERSGNAELAARAARRGRHSADDAGRDRRGQTVLAGMFK